MEKEKTERKREKQPYLLDLLFFFPACAEWCGELDDAYKIGTVGPELRQLLASGHNLFLLSFWFLLSKFTETEHPMFVLARI